MDLERIKQNLRIRSGRTKKTKKASTGTETELHSQKQSENPNSPPRVQENIVDQGKRSHSVNGDHRTSEERSDHPRGDPKGVDTHPESSSTYGRSGIEKPGHSQSEMAEHNQTASSPNRESDADFDLRPPPSNPKPHPPPVDVLSDLLFSEGYLSTITNDPRLLARFTTFLSKYKPELTGVVLQYLERQKAIKAIHYANAVAATITTLNQNGDEDKEKMSVPAAELSKPFSEASASDFNVLLTTALPAWITYSLVKTTTSCLTAEISNRSTPLTRDLVGGLSEVFCLTDPKQKDNPIVYSSEEFYRLTGYGKEAVLGHNCRFLQGQKTKRESVARLRSAIDAGEEICETLLNYRRDGRPFLNILMLTPLHDDHGNVKYFLGAQVDASRLIEGGRGLDGFERYLAKRDFEAERGRNPETDKKKIALSKLRDLSETFDLEESAVVQAHSRSNSKTRTEEGEPTLTSTERPRQTRRVLDGEDEDDDDDNEHDNDEKDENEKARWKFGQDVHSGTLPGVYQKFLLVRPAPSLRIIFASKALKKLGKIQQSPFLAHLAAPPTTLAGLKESFYAGNPVSAKIAFMSMPGEDRDGTKTGRWTKRGNKESDQRDPTTYGRTFWISATPLLGSDDKIGVWMIVLVDKFSVAYNIGRMSDSKLFAENEKQLAKDADAEDDRAGLKQEDLPIKPKRVEETNGVSDPSDPSDPTDLAPSAQKTGVEPDDGYEPVPKDDERNDSVDRQVEYEPEVQRVEENNFHDQTPPEPEVPAQTSDRTIIHEDEEDHSEAQTTQVCSEPDDDSPTWGTKFNPDQDSDAEATPTRPRDLHSLAETGTPNSSHGHSSRPSGMLRMDYLSARNIHQNTKEDGEARDVDCMSPYSVD